MGLDFVALVSVSGPRSLLLPRIAVGGIFLSEGVQKFLMPALRGAGRFEKLGLPAPELLGAFVGTFEIACGALLLAGLLTRLAAIPLIAIMAVALWTTKLSPMLRDAVGFWETAHGARTDFAMLLTATFLLLAGAGPWSLDARLSGRWRAEPASGRNPGQRHGRTRR